MAAYSYTVLRYIHDPAREEFANILLVLYSREARALYACSRTERVRLVFPGADVTSISSRVHSITQALHTRMAVADPVDLPNHVLPLARGVLQDENHFQWSDGGVGSADGLEAAIGRLIEQMLPLCSST